MDNLYRKKPFGTKNLDRTESKYKKKPEQNPKFLGQSHIRKNKDLFKKYVNILCSFTAKKNSSSQNMYLLIDTSF